MSRSGCPINLAVEVLGDHWSIVVLRDIMFGNRRSYRDLLVHSEEGIATNILAARIRHLEAEGMVTLSPDPAHKQRRLISLTEKAIALVPVIALLGAWGVAHLPCSPELSIRAELLAEGGEQMWMRFMAELRVLHLGHGVPAEPSVVTELTAAFERTQAEHSGRPQR